MPKAVNISLRFFLLSLPVMLVSGCAGQKAVPESGDDQARLLQTAPKVGEEKKAKKNVLYAFVAESSARSASKDICRDKARILAEGKLRLMIADTFSPLLEQGSEDLKLRKNLDRLRNIIFAAEILGVQQASEIEMESIPDAQGGYRCKTSLGLAWSELIGLVEDKCRKDKALYDRVRNFPAFKRLKARALQ